MPRFEYRGAKILDRLQEEALQYGEIKDALVIELLETRHAEV